MIFGIPTKRGAGLTLWGDYNDLRNLYDTVGYISDSTVLDGPMSEFDLIYAMTSGTLIRI